MELAGLQWLAHREFRKANGDNWRIERQKNKELFFCEFSERLSVNLKRFVNVRSEILAHSAQWRYIDVFTDTHWCKSGTKHQNWVDFINYKPLQKCVSQQNGSKHCWQFCIACLSLDLELRWLHGKALRVFTRHLLYVGPVGLLQLDKISIVEPTLIDAPHSMLTFQ